MNKEISRREFCQLTAAGSALCLAGIGCQDLTVPGARTGPQLISPGCRKSKVKVARIYMGTSHGLWPKPKLDFKQEIRFYESQFAKLKDELADVDFFVDELITSVDQVGRLKDKLQQADGVLIIHFNIGIRSMLNEILKIGRPTMVFAVPYSGHGWVGFGQLQQQELGAKMCCMLTSDYRQLAAAIRPFRAIHHLREAKILNLTTRNFQRYADRVKGKFGTKIKKIDLDRVLAAYQAVDDKAARAETARWIKHAEKVVEPSREDIFKSCKLALAFEKLLEEENATVMTADCYGSMFQPLCQAYAFPCIGFTRLNDMGLGGICESDLASAMTHIIFQGLSGKPGFISDPTVDESNNSIILAHCMGTTRMEGPNGPAAPYKLRTIMERQEGVVCQVKMRIGKKVTQAKLINTDLMTYFTGKIIDTPVALKDDRGCRTKITVNVDGDVVQLWKNWTSGLHRVTCYGDITKELGMFCRFMEIKMFNEAVETPEQV